MSSADQDLARAAAERLQLGLISAPRSSHFRITRADAANLVAFILPGPQPEPEEPAYLADPDGEHGYKLNPATAKWLVDAEVIQLMTGQDDSYELRRGYCVGDIRFLIEGEHGLWMGEME